jgi:MFS family permease
MEKERERPRLWRTWIPELPAGLWLFEGSAAAQSLGQGMIVPFLIIYLHNVRGFSLALAGLVVAVFSGVSFVGTIIGGDLADRFGARHPLRVALLLLAAGYASFAFVVHPWQAFAAITVAGLGNGLYWPPQSAAMAELASEEYRTTAYALQRTATNLTFGLGGALGGLIVVTTHPRTFTLLFLLDAALALVALGLASAARLPRHQAPDSAETEEDQEAPSRWSDLAKQGLILKIAFMNLIYTMTGYVLLETVLPAFAKNHVGVNERGIGLVFLANMLVILAFQMPLIRWLEGRSRMRVLATMAFLWAGCWLLALVVGLWLHALPAAVVLIAIGALFAVGECALPAQSSLIADLAPARLRARSLGLVPASMALGFMLGQAGSGFLMEHSYSAVWVIAVILLVLAGFAALRLERAVPPEYRLTPRKGASKEPELVEQALENKPVAVPTS